MNQIKPHNIYKRKHSIITLLLIVVYFLLLQSINSSIYLRYQIESESSYFYFDILNYVMVFLPLIILLYKYCLKKRIIMLHSMFMKYWIPYLIYVFSIYLVRQQVVLGDYYIDISIGGLVFWLTNSPTSDLVMMYAFWIFQSFNSLLFFIALPFYTFILRSYVLGLLSGSSLRSAQ